MSNLTRLMLVIGAAALVGCGGGSPSGSGSGTVLLSMTDGPFPSSEDCLSAAIVVIDGVQVKKVEAEEEESKEDDESKDDDAKDDSKDDSKDSDGKDGEAKEKSDGEDDDHEDGDHEDRDNSNDDSEDDGEGWIDVPIESPDGTMSLDLLQLRSGVEATLALGEIPAGTYKAIRLHVAEAVLEFVDGSPSQPFRVPGGDEGGLRVKVCPAFEVVAGETTSLVLDFDLGESFRHSERH